MLQTLRSLLFLAGMTVLTFLFGIACLFTVVLPYTMRYRFITTWSVCNLWWLQITCNVKSEISGKENIPDHACIVMANHQSTWETMALGPIFPPLTWVVKRELFFIPIFGWGLALIQPIALNRNAGRKAVDQLIEKGIEKISSGRSILIFPEGTRIPPGTKRKFKIGGAMLAEQSGAPIIPVAHNSGSFWARKQLTKKPGVIRMVIGPEINTQGKSAEQINQEVYDWISQQRDVIEKR
jgi:1-acyl-sn-glycerol-3-phosphate acyltransferase